MFLEEEGIAHGAHLLDVPCGIGRRAIGLAEAGFEITAVDPNEMGIAAATERIPDAVGSRLHFATASRDSLPGLPAGPDSMRFSVWTMRWVERPPRTTSRSFVALRHTSAPKGGSSWTC